MHSKSKHATYLMHAKPLSKWCRHSSLIVNSTRRQQTFEPA